MPARRPNSLQRWEIVLKKLDESSYWFELLKETRLADSLCLEPLQKECDELLAIFTAIAKKCKKNSD